MEHLPEALTHPGDRTANPLGHVVVGGPDACTVALTGDLTPADADALRQWLRSAASTASGPLAVDVSAVTGGDPSVRDELVEIADELRPVGRRMVVRGASAVLYRSLQASGLTTRVHVQRPASDQPLMQGLSALADGARVRAVRDLSLMAVVRMTQAVVANADGASLTVPRDGRFSTAAASNDVVLQMDHDQYDTGQGPCLDAATQGISFHIPLLAGESRWPDFVPRASARGIKTILSTPLLAHGGPIGALNIYSRTGVAFAEHERDWAGVFAEQAALVLDASNQAEQQDDLQSQVQVALASRQTIAVAQGVVVHRYDVSPAAAFDLLREQSRHTAVPLRDVCDRVVTSRGLEPDLTAPLGSTGD